MSIACLKSHEGLSYGVEQLAQKLQLPLVKAGDIEQQSINYLLEFHLGRLQLAPVNKKLGGALFVDFNSADKEYRRHSSGIRQEIAKAVGCKSDFRPSVLDVTAGLANDAYVLCCLGCHVTLVERHPVVYALLEDGLNRAKLQDNDVNRIISQQLTLLPLQSACEYLESTTETYDVIYLDPMFPERQKSAKVKKAMQYFHDIVGFHTEQEEQLLGLAKDRAERRVVVKRPRLAPCLADKEPSYQLKGKSVRFDIYVKS